MDGNNTEAYVRTHTHTHTHTHRVHTKYSWSKSYHHHHHQSKHSKTPVSRMLTPKRTNCSPYRQYWQRESCNQTQPEPHLECFSHHKPNAEDNMITQPFKLFPQLYFILYTTIKILWYWYVTTECCILNTQYSNYLINKSVFSLWPFTLCVLSIAMFSLLSWLV
jgi:hypothetical protein